MEDFSDAPSLRESPAQSLEQRLALFARGIIREAWEGSDVDGFSVQELASGYGLIRETIYDPTIHGPNDYAEPGESYFVFTDELKATLATAKRVESARKDGSSPQNNDISDLLIEHKRRAF